MTNESVYIGTDLKIKVELTCEGFSMDENDFDLTVRWNGGEDTYSKTEEAQDPHIIKSQEGDWYLCLPTEDMKGLVTLIATFYVPDGDFEFQGGIRKEIDKQDLFTIKRV
jgi:hypothetical protein